MPRSHPTRHRVRAIVAVTSGLAIGIAGVGAALPAAGAPAPTPRPAALTGSDGSAPVTVTLLTGDRVTVTELAGGERAVEVVTADPGAGVRTIEVGGDLHVIPDEAMPFVASGALDGDLFNVTKLIDYGYDDASVDATPIIVERAGTAAGYAARYAAPLPGIDLTTALPSVDATAGTAAHADAEALWDELTRPQARAFSSGPALAGGISAIHLDGKVRATLDSSVPYVDAPEAWALGYTGDGVTVAVLDTGYDDTHPDLAGRVSSDSTSFVPGEDVAADPNGHGTHVASTIAGSGAASDGGHRGVADDADLLVGKVLGADGFGQDSWIIAAMEWAGERAPIVSMSLGSQQGSDGTDLMAEALNTISAETGALFIVAAGNASSPETIGSPGSAASALTVGSVDDPTGALSWFSSQGPLFRSGALKPDLTGPGNDVTAARSADSGGEGSYIALSGTSMATPHVAGAAAILKQRHPEYTAAQLKATLTSSAADLGLTPYQAGSGLLDVDAAVQAPVVASGSGDFGMLAWGETPAPVSRTIEYANRSDAEMTIDLTATLEDTTPGSGGMIPMTTTSASASLVMDAESLTIPAGETRAVTLTVDPATVPAGTQLSGALVASIDGAPVARTALGTIAEAERYDLTLTATDFAGEPTLTYAWLWNAETGWFSPIAVDGETTLRLPGGTYAAMSFMELARTPDTVATVLVGDPDVVLDAPRTVALDARSAEQITVDVGTRGLEPSFRRMDYTADGFAGSAMMPVWVDELWAQPLTATEADFDFTTRWRLQKPTLTVANGRDGLDVIAQAGSTFLDGVARGRAISVGAGSADEFAAIDAKGRVAVVTRSDAVSPGTRAANAAAAGATLLIVVNDADGELSEWVGSEEDYTTPAQIPVASLSGIQGRALLTALAQRAVVLTATGIANSDAIWDVARYSDGEIPTDLAYAPQGLARVDTTYYGEPGEVGEFRYDFAPGVAHGLGYPTRATRGLERTEWVSTDQIAWYQDATLTSGGWQIRDTRRTYQPGERTDASYFGGIVRPNVGPGYWAPHRSGDVAQINLPSWSDGGDALHTGTFDVFAGHTGIAQLTDIYVDGELRASSEYQGATVWGLPDGSTELRVVNTATHDGSRVPSSTKTTTEWTFASEGAADDYSSRFLPMIQAYYDVALGDDGRVGDGRRKGAPVPLRLELGHVGGADGADRITAATLEVRSADGEWMPVALSPTATDAPDGATEVPPTIFATGRSFVSAYTAQLPVADRGGWVDLRVTATDAAGSTLSQEIVRAIEVTAVKGSGRR
ncbi:S8 family serine peptidase [Microbacterium sp. 2FI]|uniref:S8 family serine peptidase n=1 Tax=Microbacterium sp. 2FI TaxID=2502193 RepID=UPI0010F819EE|nr:S8 family serine peptidase [Microbacterium sp. 2FI]